MENGRLTELFEDFPMALNSREIFVPILSKYFDVKESAFHLLLIAYDAGIFEHLEDNEIDDDFIIEAVTNINNVFAIEKKTSLKLIDYICNEYADGILYLDLDYDLDDIKNTLFSDEGDEFENDEDELAFDFDLDFFNDNFDIEYENAIDLDDYNEGDKLDKKLFKIHQDELDRFGIIDIKPTLLKKSSFYDNSNMITINLEITAKTKVLSDNAQLIFTVMNNEGFVIGTEFSEQISDDHKGYISLSTYIILAKNELVSMIDMHITTDPIF